MKFLQKTRNASEKFGVRAFITYSEIFSQRITPRHVELFLSHMPLVTTLHLVSAIGLIIENNPVLAMTSEMQRKLIKDFEKESPWTKRVGELLCGENRVLIHAVQLGLIARLAILHCAPNDSSPADYGDSFIRVLLAVNELHGKTHHVDKNTENSMTPFIDIETQSLLVENNSLSNILCRTDRFFKWTNRLDKSDSDYLPISDDIKKFTGFSCQEYLTASFCVFTPFLTIKNTEDVSAHGGVMKSLNNMLSSFKNRKFVDLWIVKNSLSLEEMRSKLQENQTTYRSSDLILFLEKPIVIINDDIALCLAPMFLTNIVGTGLYFSLFDAYKKEGSKKEERFARLYGRFLESYCRDIITWSTGSLYPLQFGDEVYSTSHGDAKATDIILQNESDTAIFIEISKKRFKLVETILLGDKEALFEDLESMVVKKAMQIGKYIRALENGYHKLPNSVKSIVPIVITGQDIPVFFGIDKMIQNKLEEYKVFSDIQTSTYPLTYMSISNFENLAIAFTGKLNFQEFIYNKQNHQDMIARISGINNYLYYFCEESRYSQGTMRPVLFGDESYFQRVILDTVKEWGLNP